MSIPDIDRHPIGNELDAEERAIAQLRERLVRALQEEPDPLRSGWRQWHRWIAPAAVGSIQPYATAAAAIILLVILATGQSQWQWNGAPDGARAGTGALTPGAERPARELTPGAASTVAVSDLCAGRSVSRVVTPEVRLAVLRDYHMEDVSPDEYELDALITPELGGTTDARNLWPQRYASPVWHARVKDELERRLASDVCAGRVALEQAQRDLATDWIAAYRRTFGTDVPLRAHRDRLAGEEREIELVMAGPREPRQPRLGAYPEAVGRISLAMMSPAARLEFQ